MAESGAFTVNMRGLREVDERLASVGQLAGERVMRAALRAASRPIIASAKDKAAALAGSQDIGTRKPRPSGSGALSKAIRAVFLRPTNLGSAGSFGGGSRFAVTIAPKVKDRAAIALANLTYKRKRPFRGIYWGHLVEWGHASRGRGSVPGRGIFRSALYGNASQAASIFQEEISKRLDKAAKGDAAG
jgi:hypothetical protein